MHRMLVDIPYQCRITGLSAKGRRPVDRLVRKMVRTDIGLVENDDIEGTLIWSWDGHGLTAGIRSPIVAGRPLVPLFHDDRLERPVTIVDYNEFARRARSRAHGDLALSPFALPHSVRVDRPSAGFMNVFQPDAKLSDVRFSNEAKRREEARERARQTLFVHDDRLWTTRYEPVLVERLGGIRYFGGGVMSLGSIREAMRESTSTAVFRVDLGLRNAGRLGMKPTFLGQSVERPLAMSGDIDCVAWRAPAFELTLFHALRHACEIYALPELEKMPGFVAISRDAFDAVQTIRSAARSLYLWDGVADLMPTIEKAISALRICSKDLRGDGEVVRTIRPAVRNGAANLFEQTACRWIDMERPRDPPTEERSVVVPFR